MMKLQKMTKGIVALGICRFLFPSFSHYFPTKAVGICIGKWFVLKASVSTRNAVI